MRTQGKWLAMVVVSWMLSSLIGCSPKPAANAGQAIEESKSKGTVQDQVDYLVGQGKAFINNQNYDQAIAVANHILANLDQNSQAAKEILEKAKADIQKTAQGAVQDMKNKFGVK